MTPIEFLSDSAKLYQDTVLPVCKKYGLTYMEFGVLMFLYNNPQYNTAAQIVSMRHIPKSHVSISEAERSAFSALLDKMETNVAEHFDLKRS